MLSITTVPNPFWIVARVVSAVVMTDVWSRPISRGISCIVGHSGSLKGSMFRQIRLSPIYRKLHTVATDELLCLENASTQISMFFTSNE